MDGQQTQDGLLRSLRNKVGNFFFREEVPYGLAMVRILLPIAIIIPMLQRFPRVRELFSSEGATAQLSALYQTGELLPEFSGNVAVALYSFMLFCLITTSLGWKTRISIICATVLYTYFNLLDCVSTITKYSVIATDTLLVMCVANSGSILSLDSWLARRKEGPQELPRFPVWQARLIQVLIACVYFGAALTKIQTSAFFSGDQMRFWMLTNVNFHNPVGEYLAMMPAFLIASAYVTIVWEMCFIFTVWRGWQRPVMLGLGVLFHLGTCLLLGLYIFPMVCISLYFAFMTENDVASLRRLIRKFRRQYGWPKVNYASYGTPRFLTDLPGFLQWPQPVAFALLAGILVVAGVETEYRMDLYGTRTGAELPPLERIEPDVAKRMLSSASALREKDKVFSFDLGTTAIGGILARTRDEFTYGEVIIAQGSLNPPHEDMLLECELVDADGALVHHFQQIATREMLRCDFYYKVGTDTVPGDYTFVLKSAGREVSRRDFKLVGTMPENVVLGN